LLIFQEPIGESEFVDQNTN